MKKLFSIYLVLAAALAATYVINTTVANNIICYSSIVITFIAVIYVTTATAINGLAEWHGRYYFDRYKAIKLWKTANKMMPGCFTQCPIDSDWVWEIKKEQEEAE